DVRDVVVEVVGLRRLAAAEALLELARRNRDTADDVALLQLLEDQILAAVLAVQRIVEAFGRERCRQLLERKAEILRDLRERLVQEVVVDLDAEAPRALELHLLQDQLIEHLLL